MKIFQQVFLFILTGMWIALAQIVISIVPLKYEIEVDPGEVVSKTVSVRNTTDNTLVYDLLARSFVPNNVNGAPNWIFSGEEIPPQYAPYILTDWISFPQTEVVVPPHSQKEIPFTINVPQDATPGTYYWGVIFREKNYTDSTWAGGVHVGVRGEGAVVLIVRVSWEVVISWGVEDIKVYGGLYRPPQDDLISDEEQQAVSWVVESQLSGSLPSSWEDIVPPPSISGDSFTDQINFEITFKNDGNVHIKPEGKIEIFDEDGQRLQSIGKEMVVNKQWVKVGERIVDYIPINDEWWSVLPKSKRIFKSQWKGFLYKDELGHIKYRAPGEYFTLQNMNGEPKYLYFWQTLRKRQVNKKMHAMLSLIYTWVDGNVYPYQTWLNFNIVYTEQYVATNPYIIWALIGLLLLLAYIICKFWILPLRKRRKKKKRVEK